MSLPLIRDLSLLNHELDLCEVLFWTEGEGEVDCREVVEDKKWLSTQTFVVAVCSRKKLDFNNQRNSD